MIIPSAIAARVPEPEKPRGELGLSRPRQAELEADAEQEPAAQPDQEADARVSQSLTFVKYFHLGSTVISFACLHSRSQCDIYGRRRRAHRGPGGEPEDPVARGAGSQEDHQRLPRRRRDHGRRR